MLEMKIDWKIKCEKIMKLSNHFEMTRIFFRETQKITRTQHKNFPNCSLDKRKMTKIFRALTNLKTQSTYKIHYKTTHKSVEKLQCDHCKISLTTKSSLRRHLKLKHFKN
jgi:hypothetical protein